MFLSLINFTKKFSVRGLKYTNELDGRILKEKVDIGVTVKEKTSKFEPQQPESAGDW